MVLVGLACSVRPNLNPQLLQALASTMVLDFPLTITSQRARSIISTHNIIFFQGRIIYWMSWGVTNSSLLCWAWSFSFYSVLLYHLRLLRLLGTRLPRTRSSVSAVFVLRRARELLLCFSASPSLRLIPFHSLTARFVRCLFKSGFKG